MTSTLNSRSNEEAVRVYVWEVPRVNKGGSARTSKAEEKVARVIVGLPWFGDW